MSNYWEIKTMLVNMVKKVKEVDTERGGYLERHLEYDDESETFSYSGDQAIMDAILKQVIIED